MASSQEDLILVTGASGYLATHVIKLLLEEGKRVRGTVRSLKNEDKVKPIKDLVAEPKFPLELVEAELLDEGCWKDAVKDCTYVIHMASPVEITLDKPEDHFIKPAVEGTLNVLKAVQAAGTVKRVVFTSSIAAIHHGHTNHPEPFTEKDWTNMDAPDLIPYVKSKTLAERAAWDFVEKLPDAEKFELAVINPGYVIGPVLCGTFGTSMAIPSQLLKREMPLLPKVPIGTCEVTDVAKAHVVAMTIPEAAGHRHIIDTRTLTMDEMARIVSAEFKPQGYNVPTMVAPKFMVWLGQFFDPTMKLAYKWIGTILKFDNSRMRNVLGIEPQPVEKAMIEMCYSMIENGFVPKTAKYRGPVKESTSDQSNLTE